MILIRLAIAAVATCTAFGEPLKTKGSLRSQGGMVEDEERNLAIQSRIVGGQPAGVGQFPYYAQWWGSQVGSSQYITICGASLIHNDILLTAAHCGVIANNINVVVGALYDLSNAVGTLRTVTNRAIHPGYSGSPSYSNDLLVLKPSSPVTNTPVPLNSDSTSPSNGETLTITGMGKTSEAATGESSVLMTVNVSSVDMVTCYNQYLYTSPTSYLNASVQLCAGIPGGGKGQCQGDSGGPVVNSKGALVGVVSSGVGCARATYPGVSSRVSGNIAWIKQQVCTMSSNPPAYCSTTPTTPPVTPTSAPGVPTFPPVTPTLPPITPTSAPIGTKCADSSTTFNVNSAMGNQTCSWLSINLSRFGYLCKFVDVARACPVTCNLCGVFAR